MLFTWFLLALLICRPLKAEVEFGGRGLTVLESPSRRILQGWPARVGEVPYMVSFKRKRSPTIFGNFCGGALIAPQKILTAAHCFSKQSSFNSSIRKLQNGNSKDDINKPTKLERIYAVMGSHLNTARYAPDWNGTAQWRALREFRCSRDYGKAHYNDLGVVFTVTSFRMSHAVRTVPYATQRENYVGACTICGYGVVKRSITSSVLMLGHVHLMDDAECNNIFNAAAEHAVCGAMDASYIGRGDSGGPLVCKGTSNKNEHPALGILVGVSSGYLLDKSCMFTRVSAFTQLIESGAETVKNVETKMPASLGNKGPESVLINNVVLKAMLVLILV